MIAFSTRRLSVKEVSRNVSLVEQQALIKSIPDILTPEVVECLPVYFHGIDNEDREGIWLDKMMLEREPFQKLTRIKNLMAFKHYGFWQCMDTMRDKKVLEDLWKIKKAPWVKKINS